MNLMLVLLSFAPLLIYITVDYFKGFRAGIIAAIVTSLGVLSYDYSMTKELDWFVLGETGLIVALGAVSLKMNNDRFFKFQPTVVASIFAGLFGYFQFFDQPLLLRYAPHMERFFTTVEGQGVGGNARQSPAMGEAAATNNQMLNVLRDPHTKVLFSKLSFACIWVFLGHGLIMAYAALRQSTRAWFAWRLAIYPALIATVVLVQVAAA